MFKTSKKIGVGTVSIEANSLKELCFLSSQLPNVDKCDLCDSINIGLYAREVDGNNFYSIRCFACGAEFKLGQKKQGGMLYFKENGKFEKYTPADKQVTASQAVVDDEKAPWEK